MFQAEKYFVRSLLGIIAIQACLLLMVLNVRSFTADECYELRNLSWDPISIANDGDGFPPLFRWLLSLTIALTGESLARLFPLLTSLLGTWIVGITGKKIAGEQGGLFGALFFAFSAFQWEYAQQLRAYSLYILAVACTILAFYSVLQRGKTFDWILFAILSCSSVLTHYFAALAAMVLWGTLAMIIMRDMFFRRKGEERFPWSATKVASAVATSSLLMVPVLLSLKVDLLQPPPPEVVNPVDLSSVAYLYLSLSQGWCLGPSSIELQALSFRDAVLQIAPWAIVGFGAAACLIFAAWRNGYRRDLMILIGLLVVPVSAAILLSLGLGFSFVSRYFACSIVPVSLVICMACDRSGKKIAFLALCVLLVMNGLSIANRNFNPKYDRENYRLVVEEIVKVDSSPRVLVLSHYVAQAVRKASPDHWDVVPVSFYSDDPDESNELDQEQIAKRLANTWVVTEWFPEGSELRIKRDRWIARVGAVSVARVSGNLEIYRISK